MKTAISLPDALFERAERLAERLDKSRSELYREALAEFLARHDPDEITRAIDEVCEDVEPQPDRMVAEAARRVLEATEW